MTLYISHYYLHFLKINVVCILDLSVYESLVYIWVWVVVMSFPDVAFLPS